MKIINAVLSSMSVTALVISAGSAQAIVTVNISGADYVLDTFTGAANNNIEKFTLSQMPWLGSFNLASQFAVAADAAGIGRPFFNQEGPMFTHLLTPNDTFSARYNSFFVQVGDISTDRNNQTFYAYVPATSSPVPGPLPIFGAAAAFGMSRRLRRRIRLDSGSNRG